MEIVRSRIEKLLGRKLADDVWGSMRIPAIHRYADRNKLYFRVLFYVLDSGGENPELLLSPSRALGRTQEEALEEYMRRGFGEETYLNEFDFWLQDCKDDGEKYKLLIGEIEPLLEWPPQDHTDYTPRWRGDGDIEST